MSFLLTLLYNQTVESFTMGSKTVQSNYMNTLAFDEAFVADVHLDYVFTHNTEISEKYESDDFVQKSLSVGKRPELRRIVSSSKSLLNQSDLLGQVRFYSSGMVKDIFVVRYDFISFVAAVGGINLFIFALLRLVSKKHLENSYQQ